MAELPAPARPRLSRAMYAGLGIACCTMGAIGVAVPGWPTTVFCILALWCFKRSSVRLERWLLNHPWVGPTLRDWDENRWMTRRAKKVSVAMMSLCVVASTLLIRSEYPARAWSIRGAILALGALGVWYVLTRRTKPDPVHHAAAESHAA